jgi:hypothetical protein
MDNPGTLVALIGYTIHRTQTNKIKQKAKHITWMKDYDDGLFRPFSIISWWSV